VQVTQVAIIIQNQEGKNKNEKNDVQRGNEEVNHMETLKKQKEKKRQLPPRPRFFQSFGKGKTGEAEGTRGTESFRGKKKRTKGTFRGKAI